MAWFVWLSHQHEGGLKRGYVMRIYQLGWMNIVL